MEQNTRLLERIIRLVIGAVLLADALFFTRGVLGIALGLAGALLLLSSALGFCHVRKFLSEHGLMPSSRR